MSCSGLLGLTTGKMSEGESKQAPDTVQEVKPESAAAAPTGQGVSSVSPPVSMVTQPPATAATEDEEEESEDESEILEESPCGRWQKRREEVGRGGSFFFFSTNLTWINTWCIIYVFIFTPLKVNQRNVPGIDNAYLAMDTEEGVEVVWNEVMFSERKNFKLQEVGAERGRCGKIQLKHRVTVHVTTIDLYVVMVQVSVTLLDRSLCIFLLSVLLFGDLINKTDI